MSTPRDAEPSADRDALAREIERNADALATRPITRMYAEDPFWDARFGERGRRYALEDGHHHVANLLVAVKEGSSDSLERYARWLQTVLTTRGMCTRHVADNLSRLSDEVAALDIARADMAIEHLRRATDALRYPSGPARVLQDEALPLAERCAVSLGDRGSGRERDEVRTLVSYLADAVALARPELFAAHAAWLRGWDDRRRLPAGHTRRTLQALGDAVSELDAETAAAARPALEAAAAAVESPPAA